MLFFMFAPKPVEPEPEEEEREVAGEDVAELIATFFNLGFDELVALRLAWDGVSPSAARELLRKGCPTDVAAEILL